MGMRPGGPAASQRTWRTPCLYSQTLLVSLESVKSQRWRTEKWRHSVSQRDGSGVYTLIQPATSKPGVVHNPAVHMQDWTIKALQGTVDPTKWSEVLHIHYANYTNHLQKGTEWPQILPAPCRAREWWKWPRRIAAVPQSPLPSLQPSSDTAGCLHSSVIPPGTAHPRSYQGMAGAPKAPSARAQQVLGHCLAPSPWPQTQTHLWAMSKSSFKNDKYILMSGSLLFTLNMIPTLNWARLGSTFYLITGTSWTIASKLAHSSWLL